MFYLLPNSHGICSSKEGDYIQVLVIIPMCFEKNNTAGVHRGVKTFFYRQDAINKDLVRSAETYSVFYSGEFSMNSPCKLVDNHMTTTKK